ncbi:MAG: AmmeMemoRadiSam system protein A [Oscillospiraceae bacterium]|nr:AmmeMemoRadiSam system protein A [Oscillospiraceae bacterium]
MSIIKAYTLPHPPLAVPAVGRGKESKGIADTLQALESVALEIADIAPETIIFITPHSVLYSDYFHISPGDEANGDLGRFGAPEIKFQTVYDKELISEITRVAEYNDIPAGTLGEREASLDHGVTVPMWFINKHYTDYKSIRISQSGMAAGEHYILGQAIAKAAESTGKRVVLVASSDLSHKLQNDAPYGFAPEGPEFDKIITEAIKEGDFLSILKIPDTLRERAGECGYNSLTILAGSFDRFNVEANLLSYEGPFGVGYAVASFKPGEKNEDKNILEQFLENELKVLEEKRNTEDDYQNLARQSLEHVILNGSKMSVPASVSGELLSKRAGVFVSLHKSGKLRGCIGTIAPTTENIANEIIQNAVSAGLSDERFNPVTKDELPFIVYKVDDLSEAEEITGPDELDVKRYGVIVTSGYKRGLLLPNLDGVDTVEEQINIAKSKAGILPSETVKLERFEVIRHE